MIKKILLGIGAVLLVLIAVLVIRTLGYGGTPDGVQTVELPEPPAIDAALASL